MCDELAGQSRGEREFQATRTAHLKTKREGMEGRERGKEKKRDCKCKCE